MTGAQAPVTLLFAAEERSSTRWLFQIAKRLERPGARGNPAGCCECRRGFRCVGTEQHEVVVPDSEALGATRGGALRRRCERNRRDRCGGTEQHWVCGAGSEALGATRGGALRRRCERNRRDRCGGTEQHEVVVPDSEAIGATRSEGRAEASGIMSQCPGWDSNPHALSGRGV